MIYPRIKRIKRMYPQMGTKDGNTDDTEKSRISTDGLFSEYAWVLKLIACVICMVVSQRCTEEQGVTQRSFHP